jgi:hypothetical protein
MNKYLCTLSFESKNGTKIYICEIISASSFGEAERQLHKKFMNEKNFFVISIMTGS